ncbi:transmembrane protein 14C-like isoform X1 [Rhincodon typus]|uniref:transmembrane protein 14C-like isoform X1 n=1 Tax=Rhincodon typus TaxID=259920 RepID=UPI00202FB406|nr:transmembrane protein 14C-like isoform X1 [Rhincodon typus]
MAVDWIGFGYAALVASGGLVGYVKAERRGVNDASAEIEITEVSSELTKYRNKARRVVIVSSLTFMNNGSLFCGAGVMFLPRSKRVWFKSHLTWRRVMMYRNKLIKITKPGSCSVPSLAAGLLFGSAAGFGAYQITQDPKNIWLSLIASGALTGIMGMRFYNSGKFMPAGLVAGASFLMLGRLGLKMLERSHKS